MKAYVIRRAYELKQYQLHAEKMGLGRDRWHWLRKLATGALPNPNYNDIETAFQYYKRLEAAS
jgi:hypothetical protein